MASYSQTPEVEAALADLFGPRINELLPDRDINDVALNWDADRILIGEVRGPEAADVLEAASTGHAGLCSNPRRRYRRGTQAPAAPGEVRPRTCHQAVDLVIQIQRMPNGQRAVSQITTLQEGAI